VYFSCKTEGGKTISLCAAGNTSPKSGYVQYRFGSSEEIEFKYPNLADAPFEKFSISDIAEGNVNFTHVKFKSSGYDYVIYDGFPSGIYIRKDGESIANFVCDPESTYRLNARALRGINTVSSVDGIDN